MDNDVYQYSASFKLFKVVDYTYFAPDCLHPSQKLHGLMARFVSRKKNCVIFYCEH